MKSVIHIICLLGLFAIALARADASVVLESVNGHILLEAQEEALSNVLEIIRAKHEVEISGLEERKDEPLTFSIKGETLEKLLKRLFQYLGETNYAFEYAAGKVKRASVLPKSKISDEAPPIPANIEENEVQKEFDAVVRIKGIIEGSKAEELDLKEGDLIISYAGVRINSTKGLIRETRKKTGGEVVEMTIVRNRAPMQFHLERGFIGVRIHLVRIARKELDKYYSGAQER